VEEPEFSDILSDFLLFRLISSTQHLILATSKRTVTSENANKAANRAGLNFCFQEKMLEGNLRSSPKISELIIKYQVSAMIKQTLNG
jgi:hypothetical protein